MFRYTSMDNDLSNWCVDNISAKPSSCNYLKVYCEQTVLVEIV